MKTDCDGHYRQPAYLPYVCWRGCFEFSKSKLCFLGLAHLSPWQTLCTGTHTLYSLSQTCPANKEEPAQELLRTPSAQVCSTSSGAGKTTHPRLSATGLVLWLLHIRKYSRQQAFFCLLDSSVGKRLKLSEFHSDKSDRVQPSWPRTDTGWSYLLIEALRELSAARVWPKHNSPLWNLHIPWVALVKMTQLSHRSVFWHYSRA